MSALPLPADEVQPTEESDQLGLPTGSSGKLTPAQRARLGLDIYGDDAQQPAQADPPLSPAGAAPSSSEASEFGFSEMGPGESQAAEPAPRLAPVQDTPKLAPVRDVSAKVRVEPATAAGKAAAQESSSDAGSRRKKDELSVSERDGIPDVERDRTVLGYGVGWTFFCLFVAAVISASNLTANPDMGPTPSAFVPAVISIVLGWIVVAIGHRMKAWGWLMIVPAVVLVLGPFVYSSWQVGKLESSARAYLSPAGQSSSIDIDSATILSGTVNTKQGCFAMLKDRASGDVRIDVVSYLPATAQQQATMAMAPRYARRVPPGGAKATQRTFTLPGGKMPAVAVVQSAPPIDCASASTP